MFQTVDTPEEYFYNNKYEYYYNCQDENRIKLFLHFLRFTAFQVVELNQ